MHKSRETVWISEPRELTIPATKNQQITTKRLRELRNQAFFQRVSIVFQSRWWRKLILFYLQMRKLCIVRRGRRKDFVITAIVWSRSGRLMPTSEGRPSIMQKLVSQCDFEWLLFPFVWSAFQTVCRCFITFILRNNILICSCV